MRDWRARITTYGPASMRPPPEGGGYPREQRPTRFRGRCFNEAAARGRRISRSTDLSRPCSCCFNEAAARGRRIFARTVPTPCNMSCFNEAAARGRRIYPTDLATESTEGQASMRPPPEGGGYRLNLFRFIVGLFASMRPPPEGGGYGVVENGEPVARTASMRPPPEGGGYQVLANEEGEAAIALQ